MNKILVSRIGEIVKRKLNGNRLFGNSFTTLQAVSACWGRTPNPVNSPVTGAGCAGKDGACAPLQSEKAAVLSLPPSSDSGKTGKGLSG